MRYAITPYGAGNPVGFREIKEGWPLVSGETFIVDKEPAEGQVLATNETSLREETAADRAARETEAKRALADKAFEPDPQNAASLLLAELIEDIAALRGQTPEQYRAQLIARLREAR